MVDNQLSEESNEAIEQAYYVVEEKLQNESSSDKHMFIKIEKRENKTMIKFFSFYNDVKGLFQDYHIYYK